MSDDAMTSPPVDAPVTTAVAEPVETEPIQDAGTITQEDADIAGKQATTEVTAPDGNGTTEAVDGPAAVAGDGMSGSKKDKRKSNAGVPEHKAKKLNKKKSMVSLQLECKPGEFYWARLKGYPAWPAIICDEQMLPESLLASRPVSTARVDGSLRDDFKAGGKNAKERTFPIMFLSTNEFSWMINTALTPLDPEDCKGKPTAKMTKALQDAYRLAAEGHDIDYYKGVLSQFQEEEKSFLKELREQEAEQERVAAEKAVAKATKDGEVGEEEEKDKKKKKPRKSKGGDEDVEMEDVEATKSSKKRKKEASSDGDDAKPKKTPKVTKLNAPKTPNGEASAKKSTAKPKKKVTAPKAEEIEEEQKPQMTDAERLLMREKAVLYLRHRLQKGFLSRDQAPQESEMTAMAEFFTQLENYDTLEPSIIRATKIHKVLKAIVKLATIPRDEELNFKKRSGALLDLWNKRMEADGGEAPVAAAEQKSEEKEESAAPAIECEKAAAVAEPVAEGAATEDAEKDVEGKAEEAVASIDEKAAVNGDDKITELVPEAQEAAPVEAESAAKTDTADVKTASAVVNGDVEMPNAPEAPSDTLEESIVAAA